MFTFYSLTKLGVCTKFVSINIISLVLHILIGNTFGLQTMADVLYTSMR